MNKKLSYLFLIISMLVFSVSLYAVESKKLSDILGSKSGPESIPSGKSDLLLYRSPSTLLSIPNVDTGKYGSVLSTWGPMNIGVYKSYFVITENFTKLILVNDTWIFDEHLYRSGSNSFIELEKSNLDYWVHNYSNTSDFDKQIYPTLQQYIDNKSSFQVVSPRNGTMYFGKPYDFDVNAKFDEHNNIFLENITYFPNYEKAVSIFFE